MKQTTTNDRRHIKKLELFGVERHNIAAIVGVPLAAVNNTVNNSGIAVPRWSKGHAAARRPSVVARKSIEQQLGYMLAKSLNAVERHIESEDPKISLDASKFFLAQSLKGFMEASMTDQLRMAETTDEESTEISDVLAETKGVLSDEHD